MRFMILVRASPGSESGGMPSEEQIAEQLALHADAHIFTSLPRSGTVRAARLLAEIGDLTRFDNPRELAAFLGLVPSEDSTGESRRQGPITKAGNGHARRVLVEGAWAYQYPAKVSPAIRKRLEGLPQPVQDIAWKAQVRLCKRFRRLVTRGKHPNVVVTAIARELAAFMWAIAKEVPIAA